MPETTETEALWTVLTDTLVVLKVAVEQINELKQQVATLEADVDTLYDISIYGEEDVAA